MGRTKSKSPLFFFKNDTRRTGKPSSPERFAIQNAVPKHEAVIRPRLSASYYIGA